jgi:hypothetical protein
MAPGVVSPNLLPNKSEHPRRWQGLSSVLFRGENTFFDEALPEGDPVVQVDL